MNDVYRHFNRHLEKCSLTDLAKRLSPPMALGHDPHVEWLTVEWKTDAVLQSIPNEGRYHFYSGCPSGGYVGIKNAQHLKVRIPGWKDNYEYIPKADTNIIFSGIGYDAFYNSLCAEYGVAPDELLAAWVEQAQDYIEGVTFSAINEYIRINAKPGTFLIVEPKQGKKKPLHTIGIDGSFLKHFSECLRNVNVPSRRDARKRSDQDVIHMVERLTALLPWNVLFDTPNTTVCANRFDFYRQRDHLYIRSECFSVKEFRKTDSEDIIGWSVVIRRDHMLAAYIHLQEFICVHEERTKK